MRRPQSPVNFLRDDWTHVSHEHLLDTVSWGQIQGKSTLTNLKFREKGGGNGKEKLKKGHLSFLPDVILLSLFTIIFVSGL